MTNINDLTEPQLNTLAALGQGWERANVTGWRTQKAEYIGNGTVPCNALFISHYDPCNNGSQAMELLESGEGAIERYYDTITTHPNIVRIGEGRSSFYDYSELKLAIVRAFVASIYGTEIDFDAIVGGE